MSRYKILATLLVVGLLSLIIPLTIVLAQRGAGTVTIRDSDPDPFTVVLSDTATIVAKGVSALPPDKIYEGWLISDDGARKQSTGTARPNDEGDISMTFKLGGANAGENLIGPFSTFVVTVEPTVDADPRPSDEVVAKVTIPAGGMSHVRHLLFSLGGNPEYKSGFHAGTPKGITVGLREQAADALKHAGFSAGSTDLAGVHIHAQHVINMIEGEGSANYDGTTYKGDGFGILKYAANSSRHAGLAASGAPSNTTLTYS